MISKKGQGLSVNMVIVAVIGLVILVAVVLLFTGKLGVFGFNVDASQKDVSCTGVCMDICDDKTTPYLGKSNCKDNKICCVKKA